MNNPKSILKYHEKTLTVLDTKRHSWLGRLQTKIFLANSQEEEEEQEDSPLLIKQQNLKRVTFLMDNENTVNVNDLFNYYEHACIERQATYIDRMRSILRSSRTSQLCSINLSKQVISESQAIPISDLLKLNFGLTNLSLSSCDLSDEALRILLCSLLVGNTIQQLNLSNNQFSCKGYRYIALFIKSSKSLKSIDISQCLIEKKSMEYLSQGLRYASSLSKIIMNNCTFNPLGQTLDVFAEGIYHSNSLKELSFCDNISSPAIQGEWLYQIMHSPITELNLTGNSISPILSVVSSGLKANVTLQHLILTHCGIASEGLSLLANALLENSSLMALNLSKNPLGSDEGIYCLKNALSENSSIQSLNLSETGLDSEAVITLAEALTENHSLTRLDLSKNPLIDMAGILALAVSIKMNHTLTFLDINIPPSDEELANLQNDIVAVCTTNMLQKVAADEPTITLIPTKEILLPAKQILNASGSIHETTPHLITSA